MDVIRVSYCLTASSDEEQVREAVEALSTDERGRFERFFFARDRRDFAAAHALLRRALSRDGGLAPHQWAFAVADGGKPELAPEMADPRLSFNLSHTDGLVACIVGRDAVVGVDVEAIDRRTDPMNIAGRFFSPAEIEMLSGCAEADRPTRFIEVWTLKEAYVKAVGAGLMLPLREFAFAFEGSAALRFTTAKPFNVADWYFALYAPSERHRLAIAINAPAARHRILDVAEESIGEPLSPLRTSLG